MIFSSSSLKVTPAQGYVPAVSAVANLEGAMQTTNWIL